MALTSAASRALHFLGGDARAPPRGTGPLGSGSCHARWVSATDVLAWNAKRDTRAERVVWDADADPPIHPRVFREDEIPLREYQVDACEGVTEPGAPTRLPQRRHRHGMRRR